MRTIIISLAIAAAGLTAQAGKNSLQYVVTDNDTIICKNIKYGFVNTKCVLHSGEKKIIKSDEINVLSKDGQIKERKPVYLNNKYSGKEAMMELIDCQDGVRVYKFERYNNLYESMDVVISFYKNDKYIHSQTNPDIEQVYDFIDQYTKENNEFLTSK